MNDKAFQSSVRALSVCKTYSSSYLRENEIRMEEARPRSIPTIVIPENIRQTGVCPLDLTARALMHLHESGIVVLENAVDNVSLDRLNTILAPDAIHLAKAPDQHFNFGTRCANINQGPPLDESLMFSDVWINPFALSTLAGILGPDLVLHYACGNTALQTSPANRQPVHSDIEFPHPMFPFSFVVNIPLVDMDECNGATEVWLGSHAATSFSDQIQKPSQAEDLPPRSIISSLVEHRRSFSPPVRACVSKGSIIIRDLRLWHAGMPNLTPMPRVMLAFVWQAAWWQGKGLMNLPLGIQPKIHSWESSRVGCRFAVQWVEASTKQRVDGMGAHSTSLASSDVVLQSFLSQA
ncbi:hypothetical protein F5Y03DRAFT_338738 [Xylaria venustula]|nr:hypothetical protein F5Y03DRAFT_338738 [Xylaria venustula]